jgi:hypothetical protein
LPPLSGLLSMPIRTLALALQKFCIELKIFGL